MRSLFGRWFVMMDSSRRISLPTGLMKQLDELGVTSFMVGTPARLRCVWLIPTSEWAEAEASLAALSAVSILDEGPASHYARLIGTFQEVKLSEKRIALDESVLRWARIDPSDFPKNSKSQETLLTAVGRRLELWHPDLFEQQVARSVSAPSGITLPDEVLDPREAQNAADSSTRQS